MLIDEARLATIEQILESAVTSRASDIHIEPGTTETFVRLRIDGMLQLVTKLASTQHDNLVSRIKVMGAMNIAEHRFPQDGHSTLDEMFRIFGYDFLYAHHEQPR